MHKGYLVLQFWSYWLAKGTYGFLMVIKLIGVTFKQKKNQKSKNTLCHSFRISVIPSILLSFLPDYCHSFRIIVIHSLLVSFLPNIVIPSKLFRELQILTSSKSFPYPKGKKIGHQRWLYMHFHKMKDLLMPQKGNDWRNMSWKLVKRMPQQKPVHPIVTGERRSLKSLSAVQTFSSQSKSRKSLRLKCNYQKM